MIEKLNAALFRLLYSRRFERSIINAFDRFILAGFEFRLINATDLPDLKMMIEKQEHGRLDYFKPHKFDLQALKNAHGNPAFIMMGVFENGKIVGYFFLRCFLNQKCFVGRLIDESFERQGIGRVMNKIMYNIAWSSGFRCLSTISKNNRLVMRSHSNNEVMKILSKLDDEYLLVEFNKPKGRNQI